MKKIIFIFGIVGLLCISAYPATGVSYKISGFPAFPGIVAFCAGAGERADFRSDLEVFVVDYPSFVELGDQLSFRAGVRNDGGEPAAFDQARMVITGQASLVKQLYSGSDIFLNPGQSVSKQVNMLVPLFAPLGQYHITVEIYLDGSFLSSAGFDVKVVPEPFSIVIFPDTQYYSEKPDNDDNPYYHQAWWVVDHREEENVRFVLHMGDITDDNDPVEWNIADKAHAILEAADVPYCVVPGNHDYPMSGGGLKRDSSNFNAYFGPFRFEGEEWYGGHMGETNDNNYVLFEIGDLEFMVVNLEFAPTKDALCWADDLIMANGARRVIIVTHCYQNNGGGHRNDCGTNYNLAGSGGDTVWEELACRHSNVFAVLSGHITDSEHRVRTGNTGNTVHEILTDYQNEEPCPEAPCDSHCNSGNKLGNGWLRTLEFRPEENRIHVRTISAEEGNPDYFVDGVPWFFCYTTYDEDPLGEDHVFSFDYDMTSALAPYEYDDNGSRKFNDRTVNSDGSGQQLLPAVAVAPDGNFVVAWVDDRDGNGFYQIYARGFSPGGCERFSDITVNSEDDGQQVNPVIETDATGNFVVAWQDDQDKDGEFEIYARGFNPDGTERFSDIVVNSTTSGQQLDPDIALDAVGNFVVAWEDDRDGNGLYQIYARGFHANGSERFPVMTVNSVSSGQQFDPDVALDATGNFVVTWEDDSNNNDVYQIYARGFYADGTERFPDMTVNTEGNGQQLDPAIAMDSGGDFVVAWEDDSNNNDVYQIYARGFYADGAERFTDMTVNTEGNGQQLNPAIAMETGGGFVVAWEDDKDGNGVYNIMARGFDGDGNETFGDITVNGDHSGQQFFPALDRDDESNIVIAWQDDMDGNDYYEILARGLDTLGN